MAYEVTPRQCTSAVGPCGRNPRSINFGQCGLSPRTLVNSKNRSGSPRSISPEAIYSTSHNATAGPTSEDGHPVPTFSWSSTHPAAKSRTASAPSRRTFRCNLSRCRARHLEISYPTSNSGIGGRKGQVGQAICKLSYPRGATPEKGFFLRVFSKKNICMQACPLVGKFANSLPQGPLSAPDFRSSRKSDPSLTTCRTADTGDCSHQKPILGGGGGRCQR